MSTWAPHSVKRKGLSLKQEITAIGTCRPDGSDMLENEMDVLENYKKKGYLNESTFACNLCSYSASRMSELGKHLKNDHAYLEDGEQYDDDQAEQSLESKDKHFCCDYCSYMGSRRSDLTKHVQHYHLHHKDMDQSTKRWDENSMSRAVQFYLNELHLGKEVFRNQIAKQFNIPKTTFYKRIEMILKRQQNFEMKKH